MSPELVVTDETIVNGPWTAPPTIVYEGGTVIVRQLVYPLHDIISLTIPKVTGTAVINGTEAHIHVSGAQGVDTMRVELVHANVIIGKFATIDVSDPSAKTKGAHGGCVHYFVASVESTSTDYSVLVAARELPCKSARRNVWLVSGVTIGLLGLLLVAFALLYVFRTTVLRWAHTNSAMDDEAYSI